MTREQASVVETPLRGVVKVALVMVLPFALVFAPLMAVGDSPHDVGLAALALYPTAVAAGGIWLITRRDRASVGEAIALGMSAAIIVPSLALFITPLGVSSTAVVVVLPVTAIIWLLIASRRHVRLAPTTWGWSIVAGGSISAAAAVLLTRHWLTIYQTSPSMDTAAFHPDLIALEAIVQANPASGLGELGLMSDWPIRYHWLSYAWNGVLADVIHSDAFFTLAQLGPMFAIVSASLAIAAFAARLTRVRWVPFIASAIVVCGRQVADSTALAVNWDSPSQLMSAVPVAVGALFALLAYRSGRVVWGFISLLILTFVATGFKFSAGAVLSAGVVVAALMLWWKRPSKRGVLAALGLGSALGAVVFWAVFQRGEETGGLLELRSYPPADSLVGQVANTVGALDVAAWRTLAIVPAWAGVVFLLARPRERWRLSPLIAVGAMLGGLAPLWIFREGVPNATWFLASSAVLTAGAATLGMARAIQWGTPPSRSTRVLLLAGATSSLTASVGWGTLLSAGPVALTTAAPLVFLVVSVASASALSFALHLFRRTTDRVSRTFVALVVVTLGLAPLTMVAAQRAFPSLPTDGYSVLRDGTSVSTEGSHGTAEFTPLEYTAARPLLASTMPSGSLVAFSDDGLLPAVLGARLRPFATREDWVALKGPVGTHAEFLRRRALIAEALSPDGSTARSALCQAGVIALIDVEVSGGSATPRVLPLTCDPGE